MPTRIEYFSLFNYSPRGTSPLYEQSRKLTNAIKAKRPVAIESAIDHLAGINTDLYALFLNTDTTLIPVPGSSYLVPGSIWLTELIATIIHGKGYGREVYTGLRREIVLRKASMCKNANERPSVQEHYNSISFTPGLIMPNHITLIDDVITQGRTSFACAQRISDAYPEVEVRVFVILRSMVFNPFNKMFEPSIGEIKYNPASGKTTRIP